MITGCCPQTPLGMLHAPYYLLTYYMEQSSSWEPNCLQLVKKFPAFYGIRMFLTALPSARHVSLFWASPIQSSHPHPTSWRSILILSSHLRLGLPNGLFPSGFTTKTLYKPLPSPIRATCPAHLILLDFITRTILGTEYRPFTRTILKSEKFWIRKHLTPRVSDKLLWSCVMYLVNQRPEWAAVARVQCCLSAAETKSLTTLLCCYLLLMSSISYCWWAVSAVLAKQRGHQLDCCPRGIQELPITQSKWKVSILSFTQAWEPSWHWKPASVRNLEHFGNLLYDKVTKYLLITIDTNNYINYIHIRLRVSTATWSSSCNGWNK
jgi:hypothetical protein